MTRSLRIAVADDELDIRDYFARILPALGHRVVVLAANGEELLKGCRDTRPDLVISDIRMPDLDGLEVAAQLGDEMPVPIVLISACQDDEVIRRAEQRVGTVLLFKPIRQRQLGAAIESAVELFGRNQPG